jgi:hypothetical protein
MIPEEMARLLVTSSRGYRDRARIFTVLDDFLMTYGSLLIVHGHCKSGGDAIAHEWGTYHRGPYVDVETHEVTDAMWRGSGNGAGHLRNARMVRSGAVECAAYLAPCTSLRCRRKDPHPGHGSEHCADMAEAHGIPTRRYWQDGVVLGSGEPVKTRQEGGGT